MPMQAHHKITPAHLASLNEAVWLGIGISTEAHTKSKYNLLTGVQAAQLN